MDEPTNDLDIESLELLEDTLQTYPGTLLLVSHDRAFLDNVVTQTLVAEGDGKWQEYVGGYSDWLAQRRAPVSHGTARKPEGETKPAAAPAACPGEAELQGSRELEQLPREIEQLEQRTAGTHGTHEQRRLPPPGRRTRSRPTASGPKTSRPLLLQKFDRWEALEAKADVRDWSWGPWSAQACSRVASPFS